MFNSVINQIIFQNLDIMRSAYSPDIQLKSIPTRKAILLSLQPMHQLVTLAVGIMYSIYRFHHRHKAFGAPVENPRAAQPANFFNK